MPLSADAVAVAVATANVAFVAFTAKRESYNVNSISRSKCTEFENRVIEFVHKFIDHGQKLKIQDDRLTMGAINFSTATLNNSQIQRLK